MKVDIKFINKPKKLLAGILKHETYRNVPKKQRYKQNNLFKSWKNFYCKQFYVIIAIT